MESTNTLWNSHKLITRVPVQSLEQLLGHVWCMAWSWVSREDRGWHNIGSHPVRSLLIAVSSCFGSHSASTDSYYAERLMTQLMVTSKVSGLYRVVFKVMLSSVLCQSQLVRNSHNSQRFQPYRNPIHNHLHFPLFLLLMTPGMNNVKPGRENGQFWILQGLDTETGCNHTTIKCGSFNSSRSGAHFQPWLEWARGKTPHTFGFLPALAWPRRDRPDGSWAGWSEVHPTSVSVENTHSLPHKERLKSVRAAGKSEREKSALTC